MLSDYVIITPANNEETFIRKTIESVIAQTFLPSAWVIVDDGSTDRTAEIVEEFLRANVFMRLVKLKRSPSRNFGRKVHAFNAGLQLVKDTPYSFIGNLDADISLAPEYFENILREFGKDPLLGIGGGIVYTSIGQKYATGDTNPGSVGGAVQLFRRKCFEEIGGYIPLEHGGIDAAAEILARMKGWVVKKFPDNKVWEQRRTGSAGNGVLKAQYKLGIRFYTLGWGTGFFILRCVSKIRSLPSGLGSAAMLLGYLWAKVRRYPLSLPPEAVSHLRSEQGSKLRGMFLGRSNPRSRSGNQANTETTKVGG